MKTATIDNAPILARQFARMLTELLGPDTMRAIVERNASEPHPDVCHSHDYCDANAVMADAFRALGFDFGSEPDENRAHTVMVWNAAWDMAKYAGFYLDAGE